MQTVYLAKVITILDLGESKGLKMPFYFTKSEQLISLLEDFFFT